MGLLDFSTGGNGLLGLGGLGGAAGLTNPAISLLGNSVDQSAMRNYALKSALLGSAAALLSQGPSLTPINFGTTLGQGLASGLTAAQAAQKDYLQTALQAQQLKFQQNQDARAQAEATRQEQLFGPQFKKANLDVANEQAQQDALKGAPPAARLNPSAWGASQIPQIATLGYDYAGHPVSGWTVFDPSKLNQPLMQGTQFAGAAMPDIGSVQPAGLDARGYVDPNSQASVFQALGGEKNPLAVRALQIAQNRDQAGSREMMPGNPTMDMVHKLNPAWNDSDYNTVQGINRDFASGKNATKLVSAEQGTGHLDDAWRKVFVLPDTGVANANKTWNWIRSGFNAPDLSAADPALHIAGNESVKLALGEGGAEGDRQNAYNNFHAMGTAQDREAAFKTVVDQGNQSVAALVDQWRNAHNGSLKGFNPNVIAKRIAVTRELGLDTATLDKAYKEATGQNFEDAVPGLIQGGTLNKLDLIDWSSLEGDKFRNLKKQAYTLANNGNPEAAFQTLVDGGARLIGQKGDGKSGDNAAPMTGKTSTGIGWSFQ